MAVPRPGSRAATSGLFAAIAPGDGPGEVTGRRGRCSDPDGHVDLRRQPDPTVSAWSMLPEEGCSDARPNPG